jgi:hypothetical protein
MRMSLPELTGLWKDLRDRRLACAAAADSLKELEDKAARSVLAWLAANGQKSASIRGLGTVASKINIRVHVGDQERMAGFLYRRLKEAEAGGAPLSDNLVLQRTAAQSELLSWARARLEGGADPDDPSVLNQLLNPLGFTASAVESLHFTKEKSK